MAASSLNHPLRKRKRDALDLETRRVIRAIDERCAAIEAQELEELNAALRASAALEAILVEDSLDAVGNASLMAECAIAETVPVVAEGAEENVSEALCEFGCAGQAVAEMSSDVAQCLLLKLRQWDASAEEEMFTFRLLVDDCRVTAGLGLVVCRDGVIRGHAGANGKAHIFVYDLVQLQTWVLKSNTDPITNSALSLGQIVPIS